MRPKAELDHTFAVCAYKDSPYLEECVRSLSNQTVPANIILCTSTPSPYIEEIAGRYGIRVYVREGKSDIQDDWNFAYEKAQTRYVTLAHHDDIYGPDYLEAFLAAFRRQWYRENKTFGFITQEIRIGGLMERIRSVRALLNAYLNGEVDRIEELEPAPLPMSPAANGQYINYNNWHGNVAAGIL